LDEEVMAALPETQAAILHGKTKLAWKTSSRPVSRETIPRTVNRDKNQHVTHSNWARNARTGTKKHRQNGVICTQITGHIAAKIHDSVKFMGLPANRQDGETGRGGRVTRPVSYDCGCPERALSDGHS
jgi:hypothetical protein